MTGERYASLLSLIDSDDEESRRVAAAEIASSILKRKAGKFAEREADVFDVIRLAEWILYGEPEE